jgi:hypothetical protein
MATLTLTAGGRVAPKPLRTDDPTVLVDRWHKLLTTMLTLAVRYGELDALATKRKAWCDANPFHDLHAERHTAMWLTRQDANETGAKMMDACEALTRIQRQLPENTIHGIGALMGHPLFPMAGQWWARGARTIRSNDMFAVGAWVSMRLRAKTEAQEVTA